jgi:hypothetical protein
MRFIYIIALLLAFAVQSKADEFMWQSPEGAVRGTNAACTANIPAFLLAQALANGFDVEKMKQAQITLPDGSTYGACWLRLTQTRVFILDERGGFGGLTVGVNL